MMASASPKIGVHVSLYFFFVCTTVGLQVNDMYENRHRKSVADMKKRDEPSSPPTFDITFALYTKQNQTVGQELRVNDRKKLESSHFDASKPTHFVTHGMLSDENGYTCTVIRDAYLTRGDCNVIVVGWGKYSFGFYFNAIDDAVGIGQEIAKMINFLHEEGNLDVETTSLVGYSLGAHIVGIAGYNARYKVKYVFGLDPPYFSTGSGRSISKESGQHVQIIHTNGGSMGYSKAAGHSDFYPNGGSLQPGCNKYFGPCSHDRVYWYFAESITRPFNGTMCNSYEAFEAGDCGIDAYVAPMGGFNPELLLPGKYYLRTGANPPYSVV